MNKDFFKNPNTDARYSISPFWFWNDLIIDEKTNEQLKMMSRINAKQPIIHARSGLLNEYLSEDWFNRIENVIQEAKKNDMKVWLYDENNWPSGNCSWSITKDKNKREQYIIMDTIKLEAGDKFNINIYKENEIHICGHQGFNNQDFDMICDSEIIGVTAFTKNDDNGFSIIEYADKNGDINYIVEEDTDILIIKKVCNPYEPFGKYCVDYMSKDAIREFIDKTHMKYYEHFKDEFGKTIRGIFMDETRFFNSFPWTDTFPEEFLERKGYNIIPLLPLLLIETEKSKYVRYDYYDVISDLMREATFKQIYDWCDEHGIETTGHFLGEETLASQCRFNGDIMRMYRDFHVPGIDHLGNGIGSLDAKICSSAAHNYGKNIVSCESFGASGWDITFEEMVKISNWLFQQGINMIIPHGFYYSIRDERKNDWPPSYFFQWKYWDKMIIYSNMAARMSYMLQDGRWEADILVYYPIETFWSKFKPDQRISTCYFKDGPLIEDNDAKYIDNQFQVLCSSLLNKNLDFDILNSDAIDNFEVKNGKIINRINGAEFSIFVLPFVEIIPDKVVKLLDDFISDGGNVISYKSHLDYVVNKNGNHFTKYDLNNLNKNSIVLNKISDVIDECKSSVKLPFEILCGIDEVCRSQMSYPDRIHDPYLHGGEQQYGIGVTRYIKKGKRIFNFTNYNNKEENLYLAIESNSIPEIFIPESGEIKIIEEYKIQDNRYTFSIKIPKNRAYFIVCSIE